MVGGCYAVVLFGVGAGWCVCIAVCCGSRVVVGLWCEVVRSRRLSEVAIGGGGRWLLCVVVCWRELWQTGVVWCWAIVVVDGGCCAWPTVVAGGRRLFALVGLRWWLVAVCCRASVARRVIVWVGRGGTCVCAVWAREHACVCAPWRRAHAVCGVVRVPPRGSPALGVQGGGLVGHAYASP